MTPLRTQRLILRNWEERDRAVFHRLNADERVMSFFPFRRTRAEADTMMDRLVADNAARGYGFCAAELAATGETVGFVGLKPVVGLPVAPDGTIEIGWRFVPEVWGQGLATEAARGWLAFGFDGLGLEEIVAYAVGANRASLMVMERIGMRRDPEADFDFAIIPDTHPQLKRHVLYRLSRQEWADREKAAP
jgi:RimJ/RimL family protein N-acetyltransferase